MSLEAPLRLFCSSLSQKMEVVSKYKEQPVKITIEFSRELMPTSPDCLRYYNILFRKCVRLRFLAIWLVLLSFSGVEHGHLLLASYVLEMKGHLSLTWTWENSVAFLNIIPPARPHVWVLSRRSNSHQLCTCMRISLWSKYTHFLFCTRCDEQIFKIKIRDTVWKRCFGSFLGMKVILMAFP